MAEERGDMGLSLDEEWVKPLSALYDNGKWTERHVLKVGMVVSQAHTTMWRGIIEAAAALYAAEGGGKSATLTNNDGARHVASLPAQPYPELLTGAGSSRRLRGSPPHCWGHFLIPLLTPCTPHPTLPHLIQHHHVPLCFSHVHNPHTLFSIITHPLPPPHNTIPTAPNLHPPT